MVFIELKNVFVFFGKLNAKILFSFRIFEVQFKNTEK